MQLILVRHGEAATQVTTDESRALTPRGQQQAASTAHYITSRYQPDLFVVSPLLRAQQTRDAFEPLCPQVPTLVCPCIKPDDPAAVALEWLSHLQGECIVVVCHMNIVAYLGGLLSGDVPQSFSLAEARVYEQVLIGRGLSMQQAAFVPII